MSSPRVSLESNLSEIIDKTKEVGTYFLNLKPSTGEMLLKTESSSLWRFEISYIKLTRDSVDGPCGVSITKFGDKDEHADLDEFARAIIALEDSSL